VWEAVIKYALGKLPLPAPPAEYLPRQRLAHKIESLPIIEEAMIHLAGLPPLHRDPFDRLLIAQALQHGMTLATEDEAIRQYAVPLLPPLFKKLPG
jgi:PIN domain nuclease of toxin-antitoxin system